MQSGLRAGSVIRRSEQESRQRLPSQPVLGQVVPGVLASVFAAVSRDNQTIADLTPGNTGTAWEGP